MSNKVFLPILFMETSYGGYKNSISYDKILIHSNLFKVLSVQFDRYALQIVILNFIEIIH